jgi:hypothetical protein
MRAALFPFLALLAACGARTSLVTSDAASTSGSGGGGAGGSSVTVTSSSSTGSSSGGAGGSSGCDALVVVEPVTVAPTPTLARAPEIGLPDASGEFFLSFIEGPSETPGLLRAVRMAPFTVWPPEFGAYLDLDTDILDYVAGPGPAGPVALIHHGSGGLTFIATTFLPQLDSVPIGSGETDLLFVTGIPDRSLFAQAYPSPSNSVLNVGSYQPGSLPQTEEPLICITSPELGAAVPSGSGFLAAFVEPNPPESSCEPDAPLPGTVVSLMRYESPVAPGSFLERKQGARFVASEPIAHLHLAPTSFGAWVVFQTDGSTSLTFPQVVAARVDFSGQPVVPGELIGVSPDGVTSGPIAVAALGDAVAVAWIETLDPTTPRVVIQIVGPDGSLGAATSFLTEEAWFSRRIRLQASADGRGLLAAWEGNFGDVLIGMARIDCVGGL